MPIQWCKFWLKKEVNLNVAIQANDLEFKFKKIARSSSSENVYIHILCIV